MGKKKNLVVEVMDENKAVETIETEEVQGGEVVENENVTEEVTADTDGGETKENAEEVNSETGGKSVEDVETTKADGETPTTEAEPVVTSSKRREHGTGSVYELTGGKGFGYCISLTADKELRKMYGLKLRHLGTGKTYEETEAKCLDAISRKEELLRAKLEKLGHKAE